MSQVLDRVLPRYTFGERHATVVAATPERTYRAIKEATADEMPLVRLLFGLRSLPARLTGHDGLPSTADTSLYDQLVAAGFTVLDDQPGDEIVGWNHLPIVEARRWRGSARAGRGRFHWV